MIQNATKSNEMQHSLPPKQQRAVDLLVTGKSYADVACELEIDRGTLLRWRKQELFQRELDEQKTLIRSATQQLLINTIVPKAVNELVARLDPECDYSAFPTSQILQLLKMIGFLQPKEEMVLSSSSQQDTARSGR